MMAQKRKSHTRTVAIGIITIAVLALLALVLVNPFTGSIVQTANAGAQGNSGGDRTVQDRTGGAFSIFGASENNCDPNSFTDCWVFSNSFQDITATAQIRATHKGQKDVERECRFPDGSTQDCIVAPETIEYSCNGDKVYRTQDNSVDWDRCGENGCDYNRIGALSGTIQVDEGTKPAGEESKQHLICWQKETSNTAWVWAGASQTYRFSTPVVKVQKDSLEGTAGITHDPDILICDDNFVCDAKPLKGMVTVRLKNAETDEPITNTLIEISNTTFQTDSQGQVRAEVPFESPNTIRVDKQGFYTASELVTFAYDNRNHTIAVKQKERKYTIEVRKNISNGMTDPLQNMTIRVRGGEVDAAQQTDANGKATFQLDPFTSEYTITGMLGGVQFFEFTRTVEAGEFETKVITLCDTGTFNRTTGQCDQPAQKDSVENDTQEEIDDSVKQQPIPDDTQDSTTTEFPVVAIVAVGATLLFAGFVIWLVARMDR